MNTPTTYQCELSFAEAWDKLSDLQKNSNINVADIPDAFHFDLKLWLLSQSKSNVVIPEIISGGTYCAWLLKIYRKGLYYQVQLFQSFFSWISLWNSGQKKTRFYQIYDHNGTMIHSWMSLTDLRQLYQTPFTLPV